MFSSLKERDKKRYRGGGRGLGIRQGKKDREKKRSCHHIFHLRRYIQEVFGNDFYSGEHTNSHFQVSNT